MNAEWLQLDEQRGPGPARYGRAEIARWVRRHPELAGCITPADVLDAIRARPDEVLAALIAIHQQGGQLAGRIVLQTMLGKLVAMARRDGSHGIEDYVGQLWVRLGSYPLARRPRRIAANLALDTLKSVTRDGDAAAASHTVAVTPDELERAGFGTTVLSDDEVADLSAHRVLRTAQELRLIDESTRRLLLSVYADGLSSAEAALRHGLTPSTVRFRCSKAIRKLARHAAAIADAA